MYPARQNHPVEADFLAHGDIRGGDAKLSTTICAATIEATLHGFESTFLRTVKSCDGRPSGGILA